MRGASKTGDVARYVPTLQHAGIDLIHQHPADRDAAPRSRIRPCRASMRTCRSCSTKCRSWIASAKRRGRGSARSSLHSATTTRWRRSRARLAGNGLQQVLINAPPGDWAQGERGLASLPGRETEFAASVDTALRYAEGLACPRVHVMAGVLPPDADASRRDRHRATFVRNLRVAAREAARQGVTVTIEPINTRDVPGYFLNTQADGHADPRGSRRSEPQGPDGFLSRADRRGRSGGEVPPTGNRTSAMSRSPGCPGGTSPMSARSTTLIYSSCSTNWPMTVGSAANTAPRETRARDWPGSTRLMDASLECLYPDGVPVRVVAKPSDQSRTHRIADDVAADPLQFLVTCVRSDPDSRIAIPADGDADPVYRGSRSRLEIVHDDVEARALARTKSQCK